jgi:hypothetical protein
MADAVVATKLLETPNHYVVHLTCISDGTGETAVAKVDKSAIAVAADGAEPAALALEAVRWCIQGFNSVRLLWDHAADSVGMVLAGSGYEDFRGDPEQQQFIDVLKGPGYKDDPKRADSTGDVLLTSVGAVSGATYDITVWLRKLGD